jgi:hypothetical protein
MHMQLIWSNPQFPPKLIVPKVLAFRGQGGSIGFQEKRSGQMLLKCQRGAVLMEYVILLAFIILPLIIFNDTLFNPSGQPLFGPIGIATGNVPNYGLVGQGFHDWYQRLVAGISLPIP